MVMQTLRDHYEGTAYDLTKGMAAGPYGNPNRGPIKGVTGQWERAISMFRTAYSYVLLGEKYAGIPIWSDLRMKTYLELSRVGLEEHCRIGKLQLSGSCRVYPSVSRWVELIVPIYSGSLGWFGTFCRASTLSQSNIAMKHCPFIDDLH